MKQYPSIEYWNKGIYGEVIYAFDKLDGSNIRVEWNRKLSKKSAFTLGFGKFGTKTQMINNMNNPFGISVDIFYEKYAENLDRIFCDDKDLRGVDKITCYFEFFGPNSFAGWHQPEDEKDMVLLDIEREKKGFIPPKEFIKKYEQTGIPQIIYHGNYNKEFINNIRENIYGLNEGVVCKGVYEKAKRHDNIWMVKVKTRDWLLKLKNTLGKDKLREELNGDIDLIKELE